MANPSALPACESSMGLAPNGRFIVVRSDDTPPFTVGAAFAASGPMFFCKTAGLLIALVAGCGASTFLIPANAEQRLDGQVDVVAWSGTQAPVVGAMFGTSTDILNFKVENLSRSAQLTVDRDAIFLVGPKGGRVNRSAGGTQSVYTLGPGEVHDVNVKFPLDGFERGQMVAVHFEQAVALGGQPIAIAPLTFQVR